MTDWGVTESVVEDAALAWLESLGWDFKHGADIWPAGDTMKEWGSGLRFAIWDTQGWNRGEE